jgi:hypothetical protein
VARGNRFDDSFVRAHHLPRSPAATDANQRRRKIPFGAALSDRVPSGVDASGPALVGDIPRGTKGFCIPWALIVYFNNNNGLAKNSPTSNHFWQHAGNRTSIFDRVRHLRAEVPRQPPWPRQSTVFRREKARYACGGGYGRAMGVGQELA